MSPRAWDYTIIHQHSIAFLLPWLDRMLMLLYWNEIKQLIQGDVETLKKYCTKEVLERCKGERTAYESQGMFFDKKVGFCIFLGSITFITLWDHEIFRSCKKVWTYHGSRNMDMKLIWAWNESDDLTSSKPICHVSLNEKWSLECLF